MTVRNTKKAAPPPPPPPPPKPKPKKVEKAEPAKKATAKKATAAEQTAARSTQVAKDKQAAKAAATKANAPVSTSETKPAVGLRDSVARSASVKAAATPKVQQTKKAETAEAEAVAPTSTNTRGAARNAEAVGTREEITPKAQTRPSDDASARAEVGGDIQTRNPVADIVGSPLQPIDATKTPPIVGDDIFKAEPVQRGTTDFEHETTTKTGDTISDLAKSAEEKGAVQQPKGLFVNPSPGQDRIDRAIARKATADDANAFADIAKQVEGLSQKEQREIADVAIGKTPSSGEAVVGGGFGSLVERATASGSGANTGVELAAAADRAGRPDQARELANATADGIDASRERFHKARAEYEKVQAVKEQTVTPLVQDAPSEVVQDAEKKFNTEHKDVIEEYEEASAAYAETVDGANRALDLPDAPWNKELKAAAQKVVEDVDELAESPRGSEVIAEQARRAGRGEPSILDNVNASFAEREAVLEREKALAIGPIPSDPTIGEVQRQRVRELEQELEADRVKTGAAIVEAVGADTLRQQALGQPEAALDAIEGLRETKDVFGLEQRELDTVVDDLKTVATSDNPEIIKQSARRIAEITGTAPTSETTDVQNAGRIVGTAKSTAGAVTTIAEKPSSRALSSLGATLTLARTSEKLANGESLAPAEVLSTFGATADISKTVVDITNKALLRNTDEFQRALAISTDKADEVAALTRLGAASKNIAAFNSKVLGPLGAVVSAANASDAFQKGEVAKGLIASAGAVSSVVGLFPGGQVPAAVIGVSALVADVGINAETQSRDRATRQRAIKSTLESLGANDQVSETLSKVEHDGLLGNNPVGDVFPGNPVSQVPGLVATADKLGITPEQLVERLNRLPQEGLEEFAARSSQLGENIPSRNPPEIANPTGTGEGFGRFEEVTPDHLVEVLAKYGEGARAQRVGSVRVGLR